MSPGGGIILWMKFSMASPCKSMMLMSLVEGLTSSSVSFCCLLGVFSVMTFGPLSSSEEMQMTSSVGTGVLNK
jgi:hypothetical protein